VANISLYPNHAKALENARAGDQAYPAENGEPAEAAKTPADSGRYVWTDGPLTYVLNGFSLSTDSSQAVVGCIISTYGDHSE
jgi:hypothetical protein